MSTVVTAALAPAGGAKLIAGTAVAVVSAILYDAGYILEKRALTEMPPLGANPVVLVRVVRRSRLWLLGFFSMVAGLALQVAALTLAPVSVVQPVLAAGLVALVTAGGPLLGEHLGRRQKAALFLVIAAVAAIAVSARPGAHLASSVPSRALAALVLPVAICAAGSAWLGARARTGAAVAAVSFAASAGLLYGLGAVAEKAVAAKLVGKGILGGGASALVSPYPWLFVAVTFAGMVVFQLALQRHAASMVATVSNVVSSVCALTGASLVFGEMLLPSGWWSLARLGGFAGVGAALMLLSVDRRRVEAAVS